MNNNNYLRDEPKLSIPMVSEFLGISTQAIHQHIKNKGLVLPRFGNKSYLTNSLSRDLFNIRFKKKIVAVQIVKGGTGKTTTTDEISSCACAFGSKNLVIDLDPQGNYSDLYNIDTDECATIVDVLKGDSSIDDAIINVSPGLDIIPSRIENVIIDNCISTNRMNLASVFKNMLNKEADKYDYIFIDCPPTLNLAVTAASLYADIVVSPLNPDKFSSKGLEILRNEINQIKKNFDKIVDFKLFLNKFSNKTILSDKAIMNLLSDETLSSHLLKSTIPFTQEIPNLSDDNKNSFLHLKKSTVRSDFLALTQEILGFSKSDVKLTVKEKIENQEAAFV